MNNCPYHIQILNGKMSPEISLRVLIRKHSHEVIRVIT
jgi:hypothetical protein